MSIHTKLLGIEFDAFCGIIFPKLEILGLNHAADLWS